jgi:hypothetical protein
VPGSRRGHGALRLADTRARRRRPWLRRCRRRRRHRPREACPRGPRRCLERSVFAPRATDHAVAEALVVSRGRRAAAAPRSARAQRQATARGRLRGATHARDRPVRGRDSEPPASGSHRRRAPRPRARGGAARVPSTPGRAHVLCRRRRSRTERRRRRADDRRTRRSDGRAMVRATHSARIRAERAASAPRGTEHTGGRRAGRTLRSAPAVRGRADARDERTPVTVTRPCRVGDEFSRFVDAIRRASSR